MEGGKQYFHFRGETTRLDEELNIQRCSHMINPDLQCKKRVEIGLDLCWIHLLKIKHLRIKSSNIAGKGLFAEDPSKGPNSIIFRKGSEICKYNGEIINDVVRRERYGNNTGPYIFQTSVRNRIYEDGALHRGVGSLMNHTGQVNRQNAALKSRSTIATNHITEGYVKAIKDIRNGREILTTYGESYNLDEINTRNGTNRKKYNV